MMKKFLTELYNDITKDFYKTRFFWYGITTSMLITAITNPILHATVFAVLVTAIFYLDIKYIVGRGY